jgi:uncharacterized membrane protein
MTYLQLILRRTHLFFLDHLVYPIVLSSALALALFAERVYLSRNATFLFLPWNLFLAWIPYLCSLGVSLLNQRYPRRWLYVLPLGLVWLIFLPNAPYIITDLWHLDERLPVPFWYDLGMLAIFAWTGCFLAIASLSSMQRVVNQYLGSWVGWFFALFAICLSGLGIYLGRFMNWSSWDLILRPQIVLADTLPRFAYPFRDLQLFGVTAMFGAFLLVCYITFISIEYRQAEEKIVERILSPGRDRTSG